MKTPVAPLLTLALVAPVIAQDVTVDTFVRAESDHMIRANMAMMNVGFGTLTHLRQPTTPDNQPVIRMNQDTLYSATVLDLSKPARITLPDVGGRYMSMHVVNQDHYMLVESKPGTHKLTQDSVGTRFALVTIRTFADVTDPEDVAKAHAAQDAIELSGGAAAGWGGLPRTAAFYILDSVSDNDGKTPHAVTVGEVPVDAFWSVTVYNADGYLEANDLNVNSYNDYSAEPNEDGSFTLHFGGCADGRINCIPITPGWNYAIRMYEPGPEILDGSWRFPVPQPVN